MSAHKNPDPPYVDSIPAAVGDVRVARESDGQFVAHWGPYSAAVKAVCCFPWSKPDALVSLRDDDNREIALIADLDQLDAESREAVRQAIRDTAFRFEVTRVIELREEFELRHWRVETKQGPRTFQTHRDAWPVPVPGGAYLVRAVAGDVVLIPDPATLDVGSRRALHVVLG